MGRLAAEILQQAGARVRVTLRTYRHGETLVPGGCGTVPYEDRLAALEGADALVSATASPHYTLTKEQLDSLKNPPRVAMDLAVPRDIDPGCAGKIKLYDTDGLGTGGPGTPEELAADLVQGPVQNLVAGGLHGHQFQLCPGLRRLNGVHHHPALNHRQPALPAAKTNFHFSSSNTFRISRAARAVRW